MLFSFAFALYSAVRPHPHHGNIIYLARRGVVSHDMPADSVQFGSMHIRIRFGLNAHSIRFAESRVIIM